MPYLGKSWIDDVGNVIASIIPTGATIDLGSAANPFRNLYLSGDQFVADDLGVTGDLTVGGAAAITGSSTAASYLLTDASPLNYSRTVYAAGTAYSLTGTAAALDFGTTDPSVVLNKAGTYLITGTVNLRYTAATFAASRTVTLKLRRTNNTAADLTNGTLTTLTDIITTLTYTFGVFSLGPVVYTTALTNDAITIFGDVSVVPSAGSLDAVAANIVAIRIA